MPENSERRRLLRAALVEADLDAVICALPSNVLMLSGYWPVTGTALAVATADARIELIVPEDELELAGRGWADAVHTFAPGSLSAMLRVSDQVRLRFDDVALRLGLRGARIGHEGGEASAPASYVEHHAYGPIVAELIASGIVMARAVDAQMVLERLRAVKTPYELDRLRAACGLAAEGFDAGARALRAGVTEREATVPFRVPLFTGGDDEESRDGFVYCMSGPNAAEAYRSYQRSRARRLSAGDTVLVHCNSQLDGFWTDITRTYQLGAPDERRASMFRAMLDARDAALAAIRPGALASDVDAAARELLRSRGYGEEFRHPTGHGVGFLAINHNARPCIHPASLDLLEPGMTFNVEPGLYVDGELGMRHCDMVAVTADGHELLTPFHATLDELLLAPDASRPASGTVPARDAGR